MVITCIILAILTAALTVSAIRLSRKAAVSEAMLAEARQKIEEQKADFDERIARERESIGERFQAMALQTLNANSIQLDEQNRRSVEAVLSPIRSQLDQFCRNFTECYSAESRDRASMLNELQTLRQLNMQVSAEASRLTSALKGNTRIQGQWGEMVLLNILEHSGLEKGDWFVTQVTSRDSDGSSLRPDAVVHCPGNRDIIIDAKTSLTSYLASLEAETDSEREQLLKSHVKSIEKHVKTLRDKEYQRSAGIKSADFVFMFVPHEGAFLAALHAKPELWNDAFDSHVIIASPTHLITSILLVEHMWKAEKQNVNAQKIAEQGTKLLDSIAALLKDISDIGANIKRADNAYQSAMSRLTTGKRNLCGTAAELASLGINTKKTVPQQFQDIINEYNQNDE